MHIGLFGGSFNPPHVGHGLGCCYLLETTSLDQIWLLPTFRHAFDKALAPYGHRVRMCERLAASFAGRVVVSRVEEERGDVSYTIDTVRYLQAKHPEHTFEWIIGADILEETEGWKDFDRLKEMIRFRVLGRQGYPLGGTVAIPDVSSTEIRRRLAQGLPIGHLVPTAVRAYIEETGLYTRSSAGGPDPAGEQA